MGFDGNTGLCCLLGHPVAHSISPAMHNMAFEELGLPYAYLAFDVVPEDLQKTVDGLRAMNVLGFNLTMPHKKAIIPLLDGLEGAATLCGAVNTVVNRDGKLIGYSTDGIGYVDSLREEGLDPMGKDFVILGAGGAAEAIIAELAIIKAKSITVFKRKNETYEKTVEYCGRVSELTGCDVKAMPMEDDEALRAALKRADVLCNATNVGMGDDDRTLVPKEYLHKELFVSDIIYHPEMTHLLKDAKEAGCRFCNGKFMLLYQGAAAFKIWTEKNMPVDHIKSGVFLA
ncbi:MAG: shikimate dehydrogenase [Lachnospiraceae bacterium]|nr:shikimate dehydrogenase [Lachnospiraceae bacterium]